MVEKTENICF
jgi:hypothetical protein